MDKHYPYKAEEMEGRPGVWWPVCSNPDDDMVIGDGIPGDKESAELCARCCNIAYDQAISDVKKRLKTIGLNANALLDSLLDIR